jgi:RNA polymerase sigma-70 factor, ECF subfamily
MTESLAAPSFAAEAELLRRAGAGDTFAFDAIVERHAPAVRRFVETLGADDVDDAMQETFIAGWRSAASYEGTGSVRSWLLSVARNVVRHQRRRRVDEPAAFVSLDALAAGAGWGCDPAESRRVDAELAKDVIERALAALPSDEREILVLRELEGLSGDEAAALLHLTLPAAKSRLHRARLHLAAAVRRLELPQDESEAPHVHS